MKDINGKSLKEGDIIAEAEIGREIWEGQGIIVKRPLGIVEKRKKRPVGELLPEEDLDYNVQQIRTGAVKLTEKASEWTKNTLGKDGFAELHLTRYDGIFCGWDDVEKVGSVEDFT